MYMYSLVSEVLLQKPIMEKSNLWCVYSGRTHRCACALCRSIRFHSSSLFSTDLARSCLGLHLISSITLPLLDSFEIGSLWIPANSHSPFDFVRNREKACDSVTLLIRFRTLREESSSRNFGRNAVKWNDDAAMGWGVFVCKIAIPRLVFCILSTLPSEADCKTRR